MFRTPGSGQDDLVRAAATPGISTSRSRGSGALSHSRRVGATLALLGLSALGLVALPSSSAVAAEAECANEALRAESNVNPLIGKPYSVGLPECRAFEMVSPVQKRSTDAYAVVQMD